MKDLQESRPLLHDIYHYIFHINYIRAVTLWFIFCTFVGASLISALSPQLRYLDAAFLATSGWGGTGLTSVEITSLAPETFVILYILMYCGASTILLLAPMLYRRLSYMRLRPELMAFMEKEGKSDLPIANCLVEVIHQCELVQRGLAMVILAVLIHNIFWVVFGTFAMYGISLCYDHPQEMVDRGFSRMWVNAFLTATSFFNCGFTMTSDGMLSYAHKPGIYVWCTLLVLAGNTLCPLCLRLLLKAMHRLAGPLGLDKAGLRYALDNPRLMTTHLFASRQNAILLVVTLLIYVAEFVFFLGSEMDRPEMLAYGTKTDLAGIGYFQTVSTRNAGLQLIDLRNCNKGMLVVYIISMYISTAPLMSQMHATTHSIDQIGVPRTFHEDARSAWESFSSNYLFRHTAGLITAILICAFAEDRLIVQDSEFFYIVFEIFSAYGNVGLSMGYPGKSYSLSGALSDASKLTIMAMTLMGRLRGMPHHTDIVSGFRFGPVIRRMLHCAREEALEASTPQEEEYAADDEKPGKDSEDDAGGGTADADKPRRFRMRSSIEVARNHIFLPANHSALEEEAADDIVKDPAAAAAESSNFFPTRLFQLCCQWLQRKGLSPNEAGLTDSQHHPDIHQASYCTLASSRSSQYLNDGHSHSQVFSHPPSASPPPGPTPNHEKDPHHRSKHHQRGSLECRGGGHDSDGPGPPAKLEPAASQRTRPTPASQGRPAGYHETRVLPPPPSPPHTPPPAHTLPSAGGGEEGGVRWDRTGSWLSRRAPRASWGGLGSPVRTECDLVGGGYREEGGMRGGLRGGARLREEEEEVLDAVAAVAAAQPAPWQLHRRATARLSQSMLMARDAVFSPAAPRPISPNLLTFERTRSAGGGPRMDLGSPPALPVQPPDSPSSKATIGRC